MTSKAGNVIYTLIAREINLPPVIFWHNTETEQLNIHDGKQRLLSIYNFITDTENPITTFNKSNKQVAWQGLTKKEQDKILNYVFVIQELSGTTKEEAESFELLNINAENLRC